MKRKDVISTIENTALLTYRVNGSMIIRNDKTHEAYDIDMPSTLAIARGVMAWCLNLFECEEGIDEQKQIQSMLVAIAKSIEADINGGGE